MDSIEDFPADFKLNTDLNFQFNTIEEEKEYFNIPQQANEGLLKSVSEFPNLSNYDDSISILNFDKNLKISDSNKDSGKTKFKTPSKMSAEEKKKENNRIKARETRKRKKNYITELETRIEILEQENRQLKEIINQHKIDKQKETLSGQANLESVQAQDQKLIDQWMNGFGICGQAPSDKTTEGDDSNSSRTTDMLAKYCNYTRIKFLMKLFDIILDNIVAPKYRFKLYHSSDTILELEELKKFSRMKKYQINEFLKEKRLGKADEFFAQFDPNVRQYNFLAKYSRAQYSDIKDKLDIAVRHINKGRNICIE